MKDKIRVLMVGPDRGVHGGISAMVNTYYEAGLQDRVELKYIGTMKEGSKAGKLIVAVLAYFRFLFSLKDFDIVHVNASSDNSFMRKSFFVRAAKRHGKKIVFHQHGGDFKNYFENQISDRRRKYIRDVLDMADVMLVLTQSWKDYFGTLTDAQKIVVMPNAIITRGFEAGDHLPDSSLMKTHDTDKVLFLGRICRDKGMTELLETIDRIHEKRPKVVLYLGGIFEDTDYVQEVEKRSVYVKYLGWVGGREKKKILDECGILVLPSYYEGLPVTVIEGMLHGCCVVASNVGGIPDIVEDGKDGILVKPKDSADLEKGIMKIIERKIDVDLLLKNGRKKVLEKYSAERIVDRIAGIYHELYSAKK